jgi:ADP-ribose pyrophosphatase YjhB (NUDIX family)
MEMNFCRRCGTKLKNIERHIYRCENGHPIYANATPSTGVFLIDGDEVILCVRGIEPRKGMLDAFGGCNDGAESSEAAIYRELEEESGLKSDDISELYLLGTSIGHVPYEGEVIPCLSVLFWAELKTNREIVPTDDVAGVFRCKVSEVPMERLHDEDIRQGVLMLQKIFQDK